MKSLNEKDYKLFQSLAGLSQEGMRKTLSKYLATRYTKDNVITTKEFIYAVGNIPIALVAHMDTVFKTPPEDIYYDKEKNVMWSPDGLGADDRAGIFCILKILQAGLKPTVIFTTDEEIGAVGAEAFVKLFPKPASQINYVIQLDRRGANDCVFYDCDNEQFVTYVESFGFAENWGSFSDISVICPIWEIAGVNLSVGYMNEHSVAETLNTTQMLQTISKVKKMLQAENIPSFEYIPMVYQTKYGKMYSPYAFDWGDWGDNYKCEKCGKQFTEYEVLPVISHKEPYDTVYYCPDCCVSGIGWCVECNEGFELVPGQGDSICPRCSNKKIKVGNVNDK